MIPEILPRNKLENIHCFKNHGFTEHSTSIHEISSPVNAVKFVYNWTVKVPKKFTEVSSPEFPNRTNSEITWYLTIRPILCFIDETMAFELKLTLASCNLKELEADYSFIFFDKTKNIIKLNKYTNVIMQSGNFNHDIKLNTRNQSSEILHLQCEINVSSSHFQPAQSIPKRLSDPKFTFAEELESIFENEEFSDIIFSANGKELKLHKVILAARSPVFKAMFEHEMKEKIDNRVKIIDIEFDVLRELMSYIYTGKVGNWEQKPKELLLAADKYAIEKLKAKCEIVLCNQVSTECVVEMFIFADTLNLVELKGQAMNFIISNAKDVSDTPQWKSMIFTHPKLLAEAFLAIATK